MQNSCKIALFATVSTSIFRRSPTSFFRTTPLGTAEDIREKVTSSRSMKDSQGILLQFHRPSGQLRIVIPHAVDVAKRTVIGVNDDWRSFKVHSERANSGHQRHGFFFHCRIVKFRLTKLPTQIAYCMFQVIGYLKKNRSETSI